MAKILDMPKLSPTMEEGQLAAWHKKEGDAVDIDEVLAEVETDKATMEFRSFDKGTLLKILIAPGSVVKLGQPVAILGKAGEDISALVAQASQASQKASGSAEPPTELHKPAAASSVEPAVPSAGGAPQASVSAAVRASSSGSAPSSSGAGERVKASPYVRKLAREQGVDLHVIHGSGPNGRIVARDLSAVSGSGGAPANAQGVPSLLAAPSRLVPIPSAPGDRLAPEVRPLSMMRKTIARRLTESKTTVPHFYLSIDVNAGLLGGLREQINAELAASAPKGDQPEKVSINDLLIKACALALVRVPECNAQFSPDAILIQKHVDISVAVAIPEGLVTPVVRDADRKAVLAIAREVRDLATRAKQKKLALEEMSNGTFSISNLGMFGIDSFSAVINPPEGAILAVGQVRAEPVVVGDAVVPGKRLSLTLSCDHRVIDGSVGARFLAELRHLIERPMQILLV